MKIGQDEIRRVRFLLSYIFFFGALGGPAWGKASDGSVCVEPVLGVCVGGERPGGGTFFSLGCFFLRFTAGPSRGAVAAVPGAGPAVLSGEVLASHRNPPLAWGKL